MFLIIFEHLMVSDLSLTGTKVWNLDLIYEILNQRDVNAILSIPCMFGNGSDSRIWHPCNNGIYTKLATLLP